MPLEPPSIGERYIGAIDSANLRLRDSTGDVDLVISAGLADDGGIGGVLYRLVQEFETVRGPMDSARRWAVEQAEEAAKLRTMAADLRNRTRNADETDLAWEARRLAEYFHATKLDLQADQVESAAGASLRTEFVLALSVMKSLRSARERLGAFAVAQADVRGMMIDRPALLQITGRVLDAFLDPICHPCGGRGFTGGGRFEHSGPPQLCRPCRGTGNRREAIGRDHSERLFASHLLMRMDAGLHLFQRDIAANLGAVREAKQVIAKGGA